MKKKVPAFKPRGLGRKPNIFLFLAILLISSAIGLQAQELGSIVGTVTDPSGAAVPGVTITVTNQLRGNVVRTLVTNNAGNYAVPDLPVPGTYSIRAEKSGFETSVHSGIVLNVRSQVRVDFKLQVGAVTQQVTVRAPLVHLQTESGTVSQAITGTHVAEIDTDGRNFTQLATLVPGAAGASLIGSLNTPVGVTANVGLNFNGERQAHNVFSVDGQENYDRGCGGCMEIVPDQNAIAEFSVTTSNSSSDMGAGSGGFIQLELKSGTSQFHGEAFEFNRNTSFEAGPFFTNLAHQPKPPLLFNDFGFNIGGPIWRPGHPKKTFFFFENDWRKLNQGTTINAAAPQLGWTSGDFSSGNSPVILNKQDPVPCPAGVSGTCYAPFPNNQIPTNMINSNAKILAAPGFIFPLANSGTQYIAPAGAPINVNEQIVRIDHQFSDKTSLMFHYVRDGINQHFATTLWSSDSYPTVGTDFLNEPQSFLLKVTRNISPSLLNEFMIGFNRQPLTLLPTGTYRQPSGLTIQSLFPGTNTDNRIPTINFGAPLNTTYDVASWPWTNVLNTWTVRDSVSKISGNHTLNFGIYYLHYLKEQELFGQTQGNFTFNSQNAALGTGGQYIDPATGTVKTTLGNSFADFLLGNAYSYTELQKQTMPAYLNTFVQPWFGDTWKVAPRLTLNYGLRWDYMPHAREIHNNVAVFRPSLFNPAEVPTIDSSGHFVPGTGTLVNVSGQEMYLNGMGIAGQNGVPDILVSNHWTNFEPRFGFAFQPHSDGKTVIRGGFGLFFENIQGNDIYNVAPNPPFSNSPQIFNTNLTNPGGGTAVISPGNVQAYDPNYLQPYSEQYSLGVERQLNPQTIFSLMYVGTKSTHQQINRNINQPLSPVTSGNLNQFRPYIGWNNIGWYENSVNSNYNSLQASLRFSDWHGLTSGISYTYSHCLDYVDNDNSGFINNAYNLAQEYGNCGYDIRHILEINYVYSLPFFNNTSGAKRTFLGGWQLSGITSLYSALPFTAGWGEDSALCGCGGYRPELVGNPNVGAGIGTVAEWFNTSAFAPVPTGQFGNAARNIIFGPGIDNWDISLFKNFVGIPFPGNKEGATLQLRFEFFNVFNTTQFNALSTTLGSSNFGQATGTRLPREIQMGAQFMF
jgi:hypothetical protein